MTRSTADPLLARRLRRANQMHPRWHVWASSSGHIYATGRNPAAFAFGVAAHATVDAPSTALIGGAIRAYEAEQNREVRRAVKVLAVAA